LPLLLLLRNHYLSCCCSVVLLLLLLLLHLLAGLLHVCNQVCALLRLLEASKHHLGARNVPAGRQAAT
jgi:hypothetical protein